MTADRQAATIAPPQSTEAASVLCEHLHAHLPGHFYRPALCARIIAGC
jgi:hypothetical protein